MASEPESSTPSSGIPMKASKPAGASIRMTRSKEPSDTYPNPPEKMAEENKPEETPKPAAKTPALKPKLPPKKPGGLPNLNQMQAKKPGMPLPPKKVEEKPSEAAPAVAEKKDEAPAAAPKTPGLAPKGDKPKLTPKIPVKPPVAAAKSEEDAPTAAKTPSPVAAKPAAAPKPAGLAPKPGAPAAKTPPPKPHVVRPGAASTPSQPTQGGAAVRVDTGKKSGTGVSAVGVAIDVLACVAAVAVGYLILNDLLKIL